MTLTIDEGPRLTLLYAAAGELDERGLRARARSLPARASHVSRSYSFPYALVAWHGDSVGVDVERVVACDRRFRESISTASERRTFASDRDRDIISLWCGKEALAKALGDARRYDPRRLDAPAGWGAGACGQWRARELSIIDGYCAWVCWRA